MTNADTPAGLSQDRQCFRYDHLRRLTEAWTPTGGCTADPTSAGLGGAAPYWHSYRYDSTGNRVSETQHATADPVTAEVTRSYAYTGHRLNTVTTTDAGGTSVDEYGYDPAGNTTSRVLAGEDESLNWDVEGHLAWVNKDGQTTSFVYDADGQRLIRRDPTGATLYLGKQEVQWTKSTNTTRATRYYTHGGDGPIVATRQGATLSWLASDHHGTGQISINATTMEVTRRRHLPFGAPRGEPPALWPGQQGFLGGVKDPSTGLTHLGAREYDPTLGRFISVDPLMNLTDPQHLNGYTYANNNPTTLSDPTGLCPEDGYGNCADGYIPNGGVPPSGSGSSSGGGSGGSGGQVKGTTAAPSELVQANYSPDQDDINRRMAEAFANASQCGPFGGTAAGAACIGMASSSNFQGQMHAEMNLVALESLAPIGDFAGLFLEALNPLADAAACREGDREACGWAAIGLIPFGRLARLGRAIDAAGATPRKRLGKACSFTGDTHVLMADGTTKPIKDIEVGDQVWATDPETGENGARTVTAVWKHLDTVLDLVTHDGATVTTTEDHPYWNATDHQWQQAQHLDPGDQLHTANGTTLKVAGLRHPTTHTTTAHNLTVGGVHTYYVLAGLTPVLVHNCGGEVPWITSKLPAVEESALNNTLAHIDAGTVPAGPTSKKWGTQFKNWNGDLPGAKGLSSSYLEYRVASPGASGAGPLRVVRDQNSGATYYTWTHYGDSGSPAFVRIR